MSETLSIVGGGRVGRAIGRRLRQLGWRIGVVTARSTSSARLATRAIGGGEPANAFTRRILTSQVILIATPDGALDGVAKALALMGGDEWQGKVVLHTSGAVDASILKPLADLGAATGSMHPMQTFSDQNPPELAGLVFGIEGSSAALIVARKMIRQVGGKAVRLSGANKAAYHAAGSFACAHVLAVMETATRLLMAQGFTRRQAVRALLPLTRQTLDNFERVGPRAAWTGPMTRGDFSTVQRHVAALAEFPREYLEAYKAISRLAAVVLSGDSAATLRQLDREFGAGAKQGKK
jgi:predicted short-subunit dehydrogenase-like oxidoreductase (DUF2520 family)